MMKSHASNLKRRTLLGTAQAMALWGVLYAQAGAQMVPTDLQQQQLLQQQRRQELRSMVRQQQSGPVLNTAVAVPATPTSMALPSSPRRLSMEEKTQLRRQLTRDIRVAQMAKP